MQADIQVQSKKTTIKVKGTHIFSFFDMRQTGAKKMGDRLDTLALKRAHIYSQGLAYIQSMSAELAKIKEEYQTIIRLLREYKYRHLYCENITTTAGRSVSAQLLAGTYGGASGAVTYCAVGDDNTAPAEADVALGNETSRKALSDGNTNNAQTLLETFFNTSEAVDTHEEFGFFIDGAAGAGTGTLFNRFTQTVVKSNTESMNVQSTIDWSDA